MSDEQFNSPKKLDALAKSLAGEHFSGHREHERSAAVVPDTKIGCPVETLYIIAHELPETPNLTKPGKIKGSWNYKPYVIHALAQRKVDTMKTVAGLRTEYASLCGDRPREDGVFAGCFVVACEDVFYNNGGKLEIVSKPDSAPVIFGPNVTLIGKVKIHPGAVLANCTICNSEVGEGVACVNATVRNSKIGDFTVLDGSTVQDSRVEPYSQVGNSKITRSVINRGAKVQDYSRLDQVNLGSTSTISNHCELSFAVIGARCLIGNRTTIGSSVGMKVIVSDGSLIKDSAKLDSGIRLGLEKGVSSLSSEPIRIPPGHWSSVVEENVRIKLHPGASDIRDCPFGHCYYNDGACTTLYIDTEASDFSSLKIDF